MTNEGKIKWQRRWSGMDDREHGEVVLSVAGLCSQEVFPANLTYVYP